MAKSESEELEPGHKKTPFCDLERTFEIAEAIHEEMKETLQKTKARQSEH